MFKRYAPALLLLIVTGVVIGVRSCNSDGLKPPQPRAPNDPGRSRVPRLHDATLLIDGKEPATIVREQKYELSGEFDLETAEMKVPSPILVKLVVMIPGHGEVTCGEEFVTVTRGRDRHCTFTCEFIMKAAVHGSGELQMIYDEYDDPEQSKRIVLRKAVTIEDPGASESQ
jgi:hypothetical protein